MLLASAFAAAIAGQVVAEPRPPVAGRATVRLLTTTRNSESDWRSAPLERRREVVTVGPDGTRIVMRIIDNE